MDQSTLVNRVAESGIITINLEDYYPLEEIVVFDLKDYLFHGLILKEKEFRQALTEIDWSSFQDKAVLVQCSTDAIIPLWTYMLIGSYLTSVAKDVFQGTREEYLTIRYKNMIDAMDVSQYAAQRIVIKGCSQKPVPAQAYASLTMKLKPLAQSIMFGEPCSTVPIYKKPRQS